MADLTKSELLTYARELGLSPPASSTKEEMLEQVREALAAIQADADRPEDERERMLDLGRALGLVEPEPEVVEGEVIPEEGPYESGMPLAESLAEVTEKAIAIREQAPTLLPSGGEWKAMTAIANEIAGTPFVPSDYRDQPEAVLAAILFGREIGIGPMQSLREIVMIDGRPTMSATLMLGKLRKGGVVILESESTADRAWIRARRQDTGEEAEVEWTMADAAAANLASKPNFRRYPADMLWARAVGRLARRLGPDLLGSAIPYSAEEAADFDDVEEGEYEPMPERRQRPIHRSDAPAFNPANSWAELLERFSLSIGADEASAWLQEMREKWPKESEGLTMFQRANLVLRDVQEGGVDHFVDRDTVARLFAARFDGLALVGPPWRLSADESGLPTREQVLGRSEPISPADEALFDKFWAETATEKDAELAKKETELAAKEES